MEEISENQDLEEQSASEMQISDETILGFPTL